MIRTSLYAHAIKLMPYFEGEKTRMGSLIDVVKKVAITLYDLVVSERPQMPLVFHCSLCLEQYERFAKRLPFTLDQNIFICPLQKRMQKTVARFHLAHGFPSA